MDPQTHRYASLSPDDTLAIARELGTVLAPGDVVALTGDLGAGKTLFAKGVAESLGISPAKVVSPTFTIVTAHPGGRIPLHHVDAYRLSSEGEALDIGLDEILGGDGVCVVEWAEIVGKLLPKRCIRVTFQFTEGDGRELLVSTPPDPRFQDFQIRCERFSTGG